MRSVVKVAIFVALASGTHGIVSAHCLAGNPIHKYCSNPPPRPTAPKGGTWIPRPKDFADRATFATALESYRAEVDAAKKAGTISEARYSEAMSSYRSGLARMRQMSGSIK